MKDSMLSVNVNNISLLLILLLFPNYYLNMLNI